MAMPSSQSSKSKTGKPRSRDSRSLSRQTTLPPSPPPPPNPAHSSYLRTPLSSLLVPPDTSIESLIQSRHTPTSSNPPSAQSLHALHDDISTRVLANVRSRGDVCDTGMRELSKKRKERHDQHQEREHERERQEERRIRDANKDSKKTDPNKESLPTDSRPLTVGAHGLARQDGLDSHLPSSPSALDTAAPAAPDDAPSPSSSDASHQPPPARPVARYESFGEDPTKFDDPTIYHIRDITPGMTDDEKKDILCVARFPHDDLHHLTPGTPPDHDFSNAKPPNQINFTTFQAYAEPYIRPLTEEDVAFLKERGDRATPLFMPDRGPVPYKELWAKEDGVSHHDFNPRLPPNEARGSIENMNDDIAETDEISNGPVVSRLLQVLRHDPHTTSADASNHQNGDVSMVNGDSTAGANDNDLLSQTNAGIEDENVATFKPSTYFPEISGSAAYKFPTSSRDVASLEQRMLQELRYSGLITPESTPTYDSHFDDEVAARLRYLQSELRSIARDNGARKARVLELTEERMAMQEYSTIADDLDNQINAAYLKRNRTMSKPKKGVSKARPGLAGTAGLAVSRNAVSEGVRMLMDRRKEWRDLIGPVVNYGQTSIPKDTVFDKATMERLDKAEAEVGDVEGE